MGGCCSKWDQYLLGGGQGPEGKGGDTPKLARVSHSDSFVKGPPPATPPATTGGGGEDTPANQTNGRQVP
mgnify:CR=1 FL=1